MKKLITYILLLSIAFSFTACAAANQPVTDLAAFEEQVLADWVERKNESIKLPHKFDVFRYYGTDNGYHIILFRLEGPHTTDTVSKSIAGYTFDQLGAGRQLMAYKNGEFIDLQIAYFFRMVSKDAITKAAELHAEKKNSTE